MEMITSNITSTPLFNSVPLTIPKWRMFKLLRWVQLLKQSVDLDGILCGGDIEGEADHSKMADILTSDVVQLLNRCVDLDEILWCDNDIKGDLDHLKMAVCVPTNKF
jgi:hypothetical protein